MGKSFRMFDLPLLPAKFRDLRVHSPHTQVLPQRSNAPPAEGKLLRERIAAKLITAGVSERS